MTKLIMFDLDGTLADTIEDIAAAVNGALARRGIPSHDIPTYKLMVGNGFSTLIHRALPPALRDGPLFEEVRAEASAALAAAPVVLTQPYPGIEELLVGLVKRGLLLTILSNKPHDLALHCVAELFPTFSFALVRGETPDFPKKPDPSAALDIVHRLGVEPDECLFIGDTDVDMETAHKAGFRSVGAAWGFRGAKELRSAGADTIIEYPGELLALL